MAKERKKWKLTSKQATCISGLITLIIAISISIRSIPLFKSSEDDLTFYFYIGLMILIGCIVVFLLLYGYIFKVPDRISEEKLKKMELKNSHILSSTSFTQVYFYPKDTGGTIDIMMTIIKNEGCTFYAQLTENNYIHLIVIDKHDEEVFNDKIENHLYFTSNFKIQK